EEVVANQDHLARRRGLDRGAGADREIQARVRVALLAVEEAAQAKGRRQRAGYRLVEQQVARLAGAELAVGGRLLGQLALDALEIGRARVDLFFFLLGVALLAVEYAADFERARLATGRQRLLAGFARQRNTDDGNPGLPILPYYQLRFALIARL